jgi:hypothetical protein
MEYKGSAICLYASALIVFVNNTYAMTIKTDEGAFLKHEGTFSLFQARQGYRLQSVVCWILAARQRNWGE